MITVLLVAGVYFSSNNRVTSDSLRAQLPVPASIEEMGGLPTVTSLIEPESSLLVETSDAGSLEIGTTPQVEGVISEEAAIDVDERNDEQVVDSDINSVPVTASTGFNVATVMIIGASFMAGSLGLMIAPVVAARG